MIQSNTPFSYLNNNLFYRSISSYSYLRSSSLFMIPMNSLQLTSSIQSTLIVNRKLSTNTIIEPKISLKKGYQNHIKGILENEIHPKEIENHDANELVFFCAKAKYPRDVVLSFYKKIQQYHKLKPGTYNRILTFYAKDKEFVNEILKDIAKEKVETGPLLLNGILMAISQSNNVSKAIKIADRILSLENSIKPGSTSVLISLLFRNGEKDKAFYYLDKSNTNYEFLRYDEIIKSCIEGNQYECINEIIKLSINSNSNKLNGTLFVDIIDIYSINGRSDLIIDLIDITKLSELTCFVYDHILRVLLLNVESNRKNNTFISKDNDNITTDNDNNNNNTNTTNNNNILLSINDTINIGNLLFKYFIENEVELNQKSTLIERFLDIFMLNYNNNNNSSLENVKEFLKNINSYHFDVHPSIIYRISDKYSKYNDILPIISSLLEDVRKIGSPAVRSLVYSKLISFSCENTNIKNNNEKMNIIKNYINEMIDTYVIPNNVIFQYIISYCIDNDNINDILYFKKKSEECKIILSRPIYTMIIDSFVKYHKEEYIPKLLEEINNHGHRLDIGKYVSNELNNFIKSLSTTNSKESYYNNLQDFFLNCYKGNFNDAEKSIENCIKNNNLLNIPDFIHATLIRFYGKNRKLDEAFNWYEKYFTDSNSIEIYESLINAFSYNHKTNQVLQIMDIIQRKDLIPTEEIFNDIFYCLSNTIKNNNNNNNDENSENNDLYFEFDVDEEDIKNLIEDMKRYNLKPNNNILYNAVKVLIAMNEEDIALEILNNEKLNQNDNNNNNDEYMKMIINAYIESNNPKKALDFTMKQNSKDLLSYFVHLMKNSGLVSKLDKPSISKLQEFAKKFEK